MRIVLRAYWIGCLCFLLNCNCYYWCGLMNDVTTLPWVLVSPIRTIPLASELNRINRVTAARGLNSVVFYNCRTASKELHLP